MVQARRTRRTIIRNINGSMPGIESFSSLIIDLYKRNNTYLAYFQPPQNEARWYLPVEAFVEEKSALPQGSMKAPYFSIAEPVKQFFGGRVADIIHNFKGMHIIRNHDLNKHEFELFSHSFDSTQQIFGQRAVPNNYKTTKEHDITNTLETA